MKSVNPMMVVAVLLWVVCGAAWAGGSIEFSGGGGGFSGGTVSNAVVLTGDNASGTGTLRIRPSDEDAQIVLCEASNNSTPEMCSNIQHVNISTTQSFSSLMTNGYYDSASAVQRRDTASGVAGINTSAGTTAANTFTQMFVQGTGGASAGAVLLQASGLATSNLILGSVGTVTTDIRGPILNGGSATCNGYNAGAECHADTIHVYNTSNALAYFQAGTTATASGIVMQDSASATAFGSSAYYGSASADADYADKFVYAGFSKLVSFIRADNVGDGTAAFEWRDNAAGTGVLLADIDGVGRIRPLLYASQSNCSDGAGAAACSAAPVGGVVIDAAATTVVVSTTAVTANSRIMLQEDTSLALTGSPTCNTDAGRTYRVTARTAGTSFTITASAAPVTNPACLSYFIVN